jgi:adenylate cyclase
LMKLFAELKRRSVFRVAGAYAVIGWLLIQFSDIVFPRLGLPEWTVTFVIVVVLLGLPLALFLAWAYELTPEGVKRAADVPEGEAASAAASHGPDYVLIGLLALAVALFAWQGLKRDSVSPGTPALMEASDPGTIALLDAPALKSVAVLPFEDLSPASDQAWFADGLTREILHGLTQLPELRVMARHSSFQFRDRSRDVREVAQALGVEHIVEGWVRPSGNELRVTAQLVSGADGSIVWSESYDGVMEDVISVQLEIARNVGRMLEVYLDEARLQAMFVTGTRHPEAFMHYLRGRSLFDRAHSEGIATSDLLWEANSWFTRALDVDPGYAPARFYRMDAFSHVLQHDMPAPDFLRDSAGEPDFDLAFARLQEDLEGALDSARDTSFGQVIALVSHFLLGQWEHLPPLIEALDERTVIEASELLSGGFFYYAPLILGKHEDTLRVWRSLREHDPLSPFPWRALAGAELARNQPGEALALSRQAQSRGLDHIGTFEAMVQAMVLLGQGDEAMTLITDRAAAGSLPTRWWLESLVHSERGDPQEVERLLDAPRSADPRSDRRCWLLARIGKQHEANACAAAIDAEPLGAVRLAKMVVDGGSIPFDADAAPRFSAILQRAGGATWPRTLPAQGD